MIFPYATKYTPGSGDLTSNKVYEPVAQAAVQIKKLEIVDDGGWDLSKLRDSFDKLASDDMLVQLPRSAFREGDFEKYGRVEHKLDAGSAAFEEEGSDDQAF